MAKRQPDPEVLAHFRGQPLALVEASCSREQAITLARNKYRPLQSYKRKELRARRSMARELKRSERGDGASVGADCPETDPDAFPVWVVEVAKSP